MKIQAINTNTNFKGLFTDRSSQHGGNWHMEYRPYSWESNNTGKMAPKAHVDEFASSLPDNEEIYTVHGISRRESSKDILGTESYYVATDGTMRRTITEAPSMNREESLKVLDKKLGAFAKLKQEVRSQLEGSFAPTYSRLVSESGKYDSASRRYDDSFFGSSSAKEAMDYHKAGIMSESAHLNGDIQQYVKLMGSIDNVNKRRQAVQQEAELIGKLRESGRLIDISRRDIIDPNGALVRALKNMRMAAEKIVCMPDGLITMDAILSKLGGNASPASIIHFLENKIKRISI